MISPSQSEAGAAGSPGDSPRIVVLGGTGIDARYFIRELERRRQVEAVIWEQHSRRRSLKFLLRRARKLGWLYPLDRFALSVYSRLKLRGAADACREWQELHSAADYQPRAPQSSVPSVNDEAVPKLLDQYRPDLVIVWGTNLIGKRVLSTGLPLVNVHLGITPLYRGAHGGFWAAAMGDPQNIGVTVHRIDAGIDTGQILRQERIEYDPAADNLLTIFAKQALVGVKAVLEWLDEHPRDFATTPGVAAPPGQSKLFYSPGLRDYLRFEQGRSGK